MGKPTRVPPGAFHYFIPRTDRKKSSISHAAGYALPVCGSVLCLSFGCALIDRSVRLRFSGAADWLAKGVVGELQL